MKNTQVDYNHLSRSFTEAKALSSQSRALWIALLRETLLADGEIIDVIDIGCGTGRFSCLFANEFHCRVTAVDPFPSMLSNLKSNPLPRIQCVEGVAEKLPLADNCFDIAFMSSVVHHFSDLKLAFSESNRVLRGGGQLGVRFATQTQLRRRIDCRFFSSLQRLFAERPDLEDVKQAMLEAGFRNLRQREVKELFVCSKTEYLRKILLVHSSAIEQLPHLEYQAGLDEAKQYLSSHELLEEDKYDFMTFLTGEKP